MPKPPKSMSERDLHHRRMVDALVDFPEKWVSPEGVTFVVTCEPRIDARTGTVAVNVLAAKDGKLLPGIDNPYLFERPPMQAPDGTFMEDEEGNQISGMIEDPVTAFKTVVSRVIINQARAVGWEG